MGRVAGYVGADVPVELLTAAGYDPVRLTGAPGTDTAAGDRLLGTGVDPLARSVLTRLLAQEFGPLDLLVVSRDCEASLRLFYVLRELARVDPRPGLPPVHLVDVLHLPHRTTTRYVLAKVRELRARLGDRGAPVADDALRAAIAAHDRVRGLLRELGALRHADATRLTGAEYVETVLATTALPVAAAERLVRERLAAVRDRAPVGGLPVFLTGSAHDGPQVYRQLEAAGLLVVGEDHDGGDLLVRRDVGVPAPGAEELALAERYQHNGPSAPRASIGARAAHTAAAARERGARALVAYVRRGDDAPAWDLPAQRAATGLPAVLLGRQPYGGLDPAAPAAVRAALLGPVGAR